MRAARAYGREYDGLVDRTSCTRPPPDVASGISPTRRDHRLESSTTRLADRDEPRAGCLHAGFGHRGGHATGVCRVDPSGSAVVVDVIDGDTIDVQLPDGGIDRVRLLGINAPEDWPSAARPRPPRSSSRSSSARTWSSWRTSRITTSTSRLLRYVWTAPTWCERVRRRPCERARCRPRGGPAPGRGRGAQRTSAACGTRRPAVPLLGEAGELAIVDLRLDADGDDAAEPQRRVGGGAELRRRYRRPDRLGSARRVAHRIGSPFPTGFTLGAGARVRIHSGCGTDAADELFWCTSGSAIWNNDGDTAFLVDPSGNLVDRVAR